MTSFDVIVLGVGGMGSAAVFELARRGRRVLGLEQFDLAHDRGSSHGQTRVIRSAYFEHSDYVPFVLRAYNRWYDLEQRTGRHLLTACGCLCVGPVGGDLVTGVRAAADRHELAVESLTGPGISDRFPAFRFDGDYEAVFEAKAGFLMVEDCVRAHCDAAVSLGAELHFGEAAVEWRAAGDAVEVRTAKATYRAARLVIAAGPWAAAVLGDIGVSLTVMRQVQVWLRPPDTSPFRRDRFPVYFADVPGGPVYGVPAVDARGPKAARHYGAPELPGPDAIDRTVSPADQGPIRAFYEKHVPPAVGPLVDARTCIYTLTPDRHFVIDVHPRFPQVVIAAGFSGHGFKFASAVGEALADLADGGTTTLPIAMFRATRFA